MALISKACFLFLISFFIQYLLVNGFTTDLIHRDSPLSPYYDPSMSRSERLNNAFQRSFSRAATSFTKLTASSGKIETDIRSGRGEYLMKLSIGTPPVEMFAIADTGSDLTWVQCEPCVQCYPQISPLFDPSSSSTYRNFPCDSPQCIAMGYHCGDNPTCQYRLNYRDKSFTTGDLAADTFTFSSTEARSSVSIPKVVFGCGHDNEGLFTNRSGAGIVGLGGGSSSIINQLNTNVNGKFSYCLVPFDAPADVTSKLKFGSEALVAGPQVVSTPLVSKDPDTYYYLTLESISVGDQRLPYIETNVSKSKASTVEQGNIVIDSGTTLTLLSSAFYQTLETAVEQSVNGERVTDPRGQFFLSYKLDDNIKLPTITFHFTNADVVLKSTNTFIEARNGILCLTIVPAEDPAIFGNLSQMDFLIGYDLVDKKVSFLQTDCTKQ